jgi:hypothetical protein
MIHILKYLSLIAVISLPVLSDDLPARLSNDATAIDVDGTYAQLNLINQRFDIFSVEQAKIHTIFQHLNEDAGITQQVTLHIQNANDIIATTTEVYDALLNKDALLDATTLSIMQRDISSMIASTNTLLRNKIKLKNQIDTLKELATSTRDFDDDFLPETKEVDLVDHYASSKGTVLILIEELEGLLSENLYTELNSLNSKVKEVVENLLLIRQLDFPELSNILTQITAFFTYQNEVQIYFDELNEVANHIYSSIREKYIYQARNTYDELEILKQQYITVVEQNSLLSKEQIKQFKDEANVLVTGVESSVSIYDGSGSYLPKALYKKMRDAILNCKDPLKVHITSLVYNCSIFGAIPYFSEDSDLEKIEDKAWETMEALIIEAKKGPLGVTNE